MNQWINSNLSKIMINTISNTTFLFIRYLILSYIYQTTYNQIILNV